MSKEKITTVQQQKFSKTAFLDAAENQKERLILQVLLKEEASYSKDEVAKIVQEWKQKEVKA